jgi:hypothetical protein
MRMLSGEQHREFVLSQEEEANYLAAASEPLLSDTGMRPEQCYRLQWEYVTWVDGRHGSLFVAHGDGCCRSLTADDSKGQGAARNAQGRPRKASRSFPMARAKQERSRGAVKPEAASQSSESLQGLSVRPI